MKIDISKDKNELGAKAAKHGADLIRKAIVAKGFANVIVATGASQFEMLGNLIKEKDIAWNKVTCFHLDEYVGLPITHPASFRLYLWERFVCQLPLPLAAFNYVNAEENPQAECDRLAAVIKAHPIDVAFIGIGENAHIAFNDPPADFETESPYIVVELDEACRKQQLGEGWFPTLDDVPREAISMTVPRIMAAKRVILAVPDARKARAVRDALEGPVTPAVPASILRRHPACDLFLDAASASLLAEVPNSVGE